MGNILIENGKPVGALSSPTPASNVIYDNTDSGLSATNAQDAIDEIVSNKGGTTVDISSYTSSKYTTPSDGYVRIAQSLSSATLANQISVNIYSSDDVLVSGMRIWTYPEISTCYVKKGMKIMVYQNNSSSSSIIFTPMV